MIINNISITKERVKAWNACAEGYRWFLEKFPQGAEFAEVYAALQADNRYDDSDWLADRVFAELDAPAKVHQTLLTVNIRVSKVGENGVKAGVWYTLNAQGDFVEESE